MACWRTPSNFSIAEGVRPDEPQLLEVPRRPLEAGRRGDAELHERPLLAQDPQADLDGLRRADGVVDDVDLAGVGARAARPTGGAARRPTTRRAASTSASRRPGRGLGARVEDRRAERSGQVGLRRPAGDVADLDVG